MGVLGFKIPNFLGVKDVLDFTPLPNCITGSIKKKKALIKSTFSSFAFFIEAIIYPAIFSRPMKLKLAIPSIAVLFEGTAVQPPLNSLVRTESIPLV